MESRDGERDPSSRVRCCCARTVGSLVGRVSQGGRVLRGARALAPTTTQRRALQIKSAPYFVSVAALACSLFCHCHGQQRVRRGKRARRGARSGPGLHARRRGAVWRERAPQCPPLHLGHEGKGDRPVGVFRDCVRSISLPRHVRDRAARERRDRVGLWIGGHRVRASPAHRTRACAPRPACSTG